MIERGDRALADWGAALRRARLRRRRVWQAAIVVAGCGVLLATLIAPPLPRLVWNASASMPIGLYAVLPGKALGRGDLAVARLSDPAGDLAARRRYLPRGVPLVKSVAATDGDRLCWRRTELTIDGVIVARRLIVDRRGRQLPWRSGCATLRDGSVLLLAPHAAESFDGRYFGPTAARDLVGRAVPLWLR